MTRPIYLFLDFDGVLHPISARPIERWSNVPQLCEFLRRCPNALVVVSSSYRDFVPFDQLLQIFPEAWRPRIAGSTPAIRIDWGDPQLPRRHREVLAWLDQSADRNPAWVALDDDPDHFAADCTELHLLDPNAGLTSEEVDRLLEKICMVAAASRPAVRSYPR